MGLMDVLKNTAAPGTKARKPVPEMPETLEQEEQRRLRARMRVYPGLPAKPIGISISNGKTKRKAAAI